MRQAYDEAESGQRHRLRHRRRHEGAAVTETELLQRLRDRASCDPHCFRLAVDDKVQRPTAVERDLRAVADMRRRLRLHDVVGTDGDVRAFQRTSDGARERVQRAGLAVDGDVHCLVESGVRRSATAEDDENDEIEDERCGSTKPGARTVYWLGRDCVMTVHGAPMLEPSGHRERVQAGTTNRPPPMVLETWLRLRPVRQTRVFPDPG